MEMNGIETTAPAGPWTGTRFGRCKSPPDCGLSMEGVLAMRSSHVLCVVLAVLSVDAAGRVALAAADAPSVKLALSFQPVHGASVAQPKPEEYDRCKVEVERTGKASGWVVTGPNGEVVRRFIDTNGDNVVDQWRY